MHMSQYSLKVIDIVDRDVGTDFVTFVEEQIIFH